MKQRLLLTAFLFSTLFSFAQIETFDASQLSSSTPAKPTKSEILKHVDYPINLSSGPLDLVGHEIYLVTDHVKEQVNLPWQPRNYDCPCILISINKEGTELSV